MMRMVNMHEAKTQLSALVRELRSGAEREIVLAAGGKPVAKLVPYGGARRSLGLDEGTIEIARDFDALNSEIAAAMEAE